MRAAPSCIRQPATCLSLVAVWGAVIVLLAVNLHHIAVNSGPFPRRDDLDWVDALSPLRGINLQWLWSAWNEHRLPLPRLIGTAIVRTFGDLRAALYFDVALQAIMAAAMILTVRRVRGSTEIVDAAFPLLILSPGAGALSLVLQGITYLVPIAILVAILVLIASRSSMPSPRRSLAIGIGTCLLPLCGGPGLTTAPVLLVWMFALGWRVRHSSSAPERTARNILWAGTAATMVVISLYFVCFERPSHAAWNPSIANIILQAWKFLAVGLGVTSKVAWPWSGAAVVLLGATAAVVLLLAMARDPAERVRGFGLGSMGVAAACMAVATGLARCIPGSEAAFDTRYVPLSSLWWSCALLICLMYAPRMLGRCMGLGVIALLLAFLPSHLRFLHETGATNREVTDAFSVDVAEGLGNDELVRRYPSCFFSDSRFFAHHLETMRVGGMWPALESYAKRRTRVALAHRISPQRIESPQDVSYRWLYNQFVLIGPADYTLHCARNPIARRVGGCLGIHPNSYLKQGVRFTIEVVRPGSPAQLVFDRTLQPRDMDSDRGFQEFSVNLPAEFSGAELAFTVSGQGLIKDSPTWAFWSQLHWD